MSYLSNLIENMRRRGATELVIESTKGLLTSNLNSFDVVRGVVQHAMSNNLQVLTADGIKNFHNENRHGFSGLLVDKLTLFLFQQ